MCSASQPCCLPITEAMRSAKHFFPQQRVAAIAGTERPDLMRLGKMHDVLVVLVARPRHIFFAGSEWRADGMQRGHERTVVAEHIQHLAAHARHQLHVDGDVRRIGQLDTDVRDMRTQRTHAERHHVHGAALHAAVEQAAQRGLHFVRRHPVIGGAGVLLLLRADEGAVFNPRHVGRIGKRENTNSAAAFRSAFLNVPAATSSPQRRLYSSSEPSHQ